MTQSTTYNNYIRFVLLSGMVFLAAFSLHSTAHAAKHDDGEDQSVIDPIVAPFVGTSTADTSDGTTANNNNASTTPVAPKTEATSTEPVATSTPESQRESQSKKDAPSDDTKYKKNLENILNQTIEPEKPITQSVKKQPTIVETATTTKKTATSTNSTASSTATSTVAGFARTTDGGSNNMSNPSNYYFPLDNLSPETTYSLSGLAILLGILGSVLILREPKEYVEPAWVPQFGEQSLLEP